MFTPDVVYLRWADIDTKVLGTLSFIVVCLTRQNERHLVILKKSSPGNIKESDCTGAKFYYQMRELFTRILALYRETLQLNNPFQKKIQFISIQIPSNTCIESCPAVINNIRCHPYKRASGPFVCGSTKVCVTVSFINHYKHAIWLLA